MNRSPSLLTHFISIDGSLMKSNYLLLLILDRPPCPDGMLIVERWCSTPCTEAKETLDSVPYLVDFDTLYFLFCLPSPGVFLSSPCHSSPPSVSFTAAAASRAPDRSITAFSQHRIQTCTPGSRYLLLEIGRASCSK